VARLHDLFDRQAEWEALSAFASSPGPGIRLGLVRGRRRQGKSYLLRRLAAVAGGSAFYFQAIEGERSRSLSDLGDALGAHLGVPGGRIALGDWGQAISALAGLGKPSSPVLVVLDEFPYLLAEAPELPSTIQRAIDRSRDDGAPVRLVLCGSALSAMAGLLTGTEALRGRAVLDLVVGSFDYRTTAAFWGIDDPATAFTVDAVVGGTPAYRDLIGPAPPRRPADVERWLVGGVLNPASALFREDDYLLSEDRALSNRGLYHAVLASIAQGATTQAGIASVLARPQIAVQHPLRALEETGFVVRAEDALRSRRPIYRIADPIVRFHQVVTRRDLARFEERRAAEAWSDARPRFATHVLGPHFEELARQFTFRYAAASTVGGPVARVAPAVVNDRGARRQHEVDIVALGRDDRGAEVVLAIGEAKHTTARRGLGDLERLESLRALIASRLPSAASARLLLFSAAGFGSALATRAAGRDDVELIDLARLYRGS
jgi:hypothetical protein